MSTIEAFTKRTRDLSAYSMETTTAATPAQSGSAVLDTPSDVETAGGGGGGAVFASDRSAISQILNWFNKHDRNALKRDGYTEFGRLNENCGRTLGTFAGVFSPVALSMFSALLFLRVGFVVGNAGLLVTLLQFAIAYVIIYCTVSSVCAVSTNGEIQGGGAYFMISRTLGPEFGGSIGTLFFFANIVSSALYTVGFAEGLINNFGPSGYLVGKGNTLLPDGRWWSFLYASGVNATNLLICVIGAKLFAKTTVFIFVTTTLCIASSFFSFFSVRTMNVTIPEANTFYQNTTGLYSAFNATMLQDNLYPQYGTDYTSNGVQVSFSSVFGVLFSGVTGIMAGANMSGELKNPGHSIPKGTFSAVTFTFVIYVALSVLSASSCQRFLLQNDYLYLMPINIWPPFITIGILTATFSASLSTLIGSSRVLEALARDNIFGNYLSIVTRGTWKSNPIVAVIIAWSLVQLMLLVGSLNTIAQINSILFLLSYFALNLACLGLELASAPNFRPAFKFFTWYSAAIGLTGSCVMMFVINSFYASSSIGLCLVIVLLLHLFSPARTVAWGSISQALIFHQVRKYLLLLDSRKDHVKFWRPQILLMVKDARAACPLIDFVNDLKKSGLYVLGHVKVVRNHLNLEYDPIADEHAEWLAFIDALKVKAFVELTVAESIREGLIHLIRLSGMGAMKPNTIIFGFYHNPVLLSSQLHDGTVAAFGSSGDRSEPVETVRDCETPLTELLPDDYVRMVNDVLKIKKNVCLCRYFNRFDKPSAIKNAKYIDVWPVNSFQPTDDDAFDTTSLFMCQLACILTMVQDWKSLRVRVFLSSDEGADDSGRSETGQVDDENLNKLKSLLHSLRIFATVNKVKEWPSNASSLSQFTSDRLPGNIKSYFKKANQVILSECSSTAVVFIYLPAPSISPNEEDESYRNFSRNYLNCLTELTDNLPPTVMVHGTNAVTSTTL
ncbi:solute carrier family 12 member 9 [Planococcus citri]|uniref:solute carrier family 12 member 9 n=1 Tax=Planococcus citri TaxID=170843 RepID=UPI0031F9111A